MHQNTHFETQKLTQKNPGSGSTTHISSILHKPIALHIYNDQETYQNMGIQTANPI